MMARFPAPNSHGAPSYRPSVEAHCARAPPRHAGPRAGRHRRLLRGHRASFFGVSPKPNARPSFSSIPRAAVGAGRPYEDGEPASVSVCQGDVRNGPSESIKMKYPVLIEERALRCQLRRRWQISRWRRLDVRVRNLVEGQSNFEQTRRSMCPPWGLWGAPARHYNECSAPAGRERSFAIAYGNHRTVPSMPRRSCTPVAAIAGQPAGADPQAVRADVMPSSCPRAEEQRAQRVRRGDPS